MKNIIFKNEVLEMINKLEFFIKSEKLELDKSLKDSLNASLIHLRQVNERI